MTLSRMIISIISDQTDPPLSGVITNTVFGPNTFSASETSWLMPLIYVIFVDIFFDQLLFVVIIYKIINKIINHHWANIFYSDTIHFFQNSTLLFKIHISLRQSPHISFSLQWLQKPIKTDDHPTELAAPKVLDSNTFAFVLLLWLVTRIVFLFFASWRTKDYYRKPGAVSEPRCSWHIRTADFALLLGLRALSSWGFSLVVFLFHPKTKFTWDTFFGNKEVHCSFRNYLVMASSVIAWVACLSFRCFKVVIFKSSKTILMVDWARVLLIDKPDHLNQSISNQTALSPLSIS